MTTTISSQRGHNHQHGFTLLELLMVMFVLSLLIMISYPVYRNYMVRAKVAEGVSMIGPAKNGVVEYYLGNSQFPVNNSQAGIANPSGNASRWVSRIEIVANPPGSIQITYDSETVTAVGESNTLIFTPAFDDVGNTMRWSCQLGSLANKYRPRNCTTTEQAE